MMRRILFVRRLTKIWGYVHHRGSWVIIRPGSLTDQWSFEHPSLLLTGFRVIIFVWGMQRCVEGAMDGMRRGLLLRLRGSEIRIYFFKLNNEIPLEEGIRAGSSYTLWIIMMIKWVCVGIGLVMFYILCCWWLKRVEKYILLSRHWFLVIRVNIIPSRKRKGTLVLT